MPHSSKPSSVATLSSEDRTLLDALTRAMREVDPRSDVSWTPWSDEMLDRHALPLFARQYRDNQALRALCDRRHLTPDTVTSWRELPAIPTDAFKFMRMSVASEAQTVRTFRTSGTTQGDRGEHHFATLEVYAASLQKPFERYVLPDRDTMRMLILAPPAGDLEESSLSFMLSELCQKLGAPGSTHVIGRARGELCYDMELLHAQLDEVERDGEPVMILSTAFALMQLFDADPARSWRLPEGSRLMETGGFKGRSREVSREELYGLFTTRLGIPSTHCLSEYSMTELSSQAYSNTLHRVLTGRADSDEHRASFGRYEVPPWVRLQVVDPLSLEPIEEPDRVGLVRWFDLANTESSLLVQTSDRGILDTHGRLTLLGRAPDSELRGCSLTIEELLDGSA